MNQAIDSKPQNLSVVNPKVNNLAVVDLKPKNTSFGGQNFTYLENKTIRVGEPMGLLLTLLYPTTVTFVGPRL